MTSVLAVSSYFTAHNITNLKTNKIMTNKIPQIGTKEFNDLASACFGGKPKQEILEEFFESVKEKTVLKTRADDKQNN